MTATQQRRFNGLLDRNMAKISHLSGGTYFAVFRWISDSWNLNQQFEIVKITHAAALIEPINCRFQDIIEVALRYNITRSSKPNIVRFIHVQSEPHGVIDH